MNNWIKASDMLPAAQKGSVYSRPVVAVSKDGRIYIAVYVPTEECWNEEWHAPNGLIHEITHWTDFPKEEQEQNE